MKKGPKALKIEDTVKVFREIAKHIDANPAVMNTEGVFRISANADNPPEIVKKILSKKDIAKKGYSIHDLIGTLKFALRNNILLQHDNPYIIYLRKALNDVTSDKPETITAAVKGVQQLIDNLGKSTDKKDQAIAEIMYTYIHLAHLASTYADTNKMTPDNLSVAAIGPLFYNNIMITNDPMEALDLTSRAGPVAASAVESSDFRASYQSPNVLRAKALISSEVVKNVHPLSSSSLVASSSKENEIPEKPEKRSDHRKR